ncbi:unnamed protein product [Spirodela intermedia]|uniref:Uncharacterized protein n=1 Tax=Spirodela intermedia TaxID=51605 RepID=A0A7I8IAQ9_SPIIN|nr:unnamed protein product [Spirodela intermedia]CAA6654122.1 unnamed protein product [Spirodela intermedia]
MGTGTVCWAGPCIRPPCAYASSSSNPQDPNETASTFLSQTVNGSHQFKISGYSMSKGLGIGKYIASDTFEVGGHSWAIYFYPDGKNPEDNAAYVSLFVALASEGTGGYKRFFKRTALDTSDYVKDDSLLVRCSVGVVRSRTEGPELYSVAVPQSNIGQHFGQLLESGKAADVRFEVDGEIISAHRLVLATRSPVFRAQLFGPMKDRNTDCIKVEDMEAPVFKALLHFMYWDSLPDMEELTVAADRYAMERLRLLCEANLCEDVAINTVATTLALAEQHHCFQLKAVCLKFIALPENLRAVMQTDGFEYLKVSCPALLTELLEYVAKVREHSLAACLGPSEDLDSGAAAGRRVKPRI